jgi:hypothetical protein
MKFAIEDFYKNLSFNPNAFKIRQKDRAVYSRTNFVLFLAASQIPHKVVGATLIVILLTVIVTITIDTEHIIACPLQQFLR